MKKPRPKLFRAAHTREPVYVSCGAGAVIVGDIMFCDAKAAETAGRRRQPGRRLA
jgi:FMN phosphatase YigB (HAD superfamily)